MGKMNILYQFSSSYAKYAGISLTSLIQNMDKKNSINVYLLAVEEIDQDDKTKFQELVAPVGNLYFLDAHLITKKMETYKLQSFHGSKATYYKFFFDELIFEDLDRILYIDSDTIVAGDVSQLYYEDINKPLAMALDSVIMCYLNPSLKE